MNSSFGIHDALNQAMDPAFAGMTGVGGMSTFRGCGPPARCGRDARAPRGASRPSFPRKRESIRVSESRNLRYEFARGANGFSTDLPPAFGGPGFTPAEIDDMKTRNAV